jgi:CheY-like chemotaxis protein
MNRKILFVDDDINILNAHRRNLRSKFELLFAGSGAEGLEVLKKSAPLAAVVSDFRMPEMDGITFLSKVRLNSKDTVRVMLTGYADVQSAINAVNEGNIFRFLTKPCQPDVLIKTLEAAVEQYQLVNAERELLDHTFKGTLKVLIDILAVVNPVAFSKAGRLRNIIKELGNNLNSDLKWKLEIAALLSQIGCITLPAEILEKNNKRISLTPKEEELFLSHPQVGKSLLINIPRLEEIAEAIAYQEKSYKKFNNTEEDNKSKNIEVIAKLLKHAVDLDKIRESEKSAESFGKKQEHKTESAHGVKANSETYIDLERKYIVKELLVKNLKPGMILVEDILDKSDVPIVAKGTEISEVLILRLANFISLKRISEPISVFVFNG